MKELIIKVARDEARATAELGYTTRPLQETIFDMMAWMELADELNS